MRQRSDPETMEPQAVEADAPEAAVSSPTLEPELTQEEPAESLVEMVLSEHEKRHEAPSARIEGVVIGVLGGLGPGGEPLVDFPDNPRGGPMPARGLVSAGREAVGRAVALMFEGGDPARPVLLGLVHTKSPMEDEAHAIEPVSAAGEEEKTKGFEVEADGERVVVSAEREIVLRCGKASITLTSAGKILIRGAYVLTRASGANCIQGGSVQIN